MLLYKTADGPALDLEDAHYDLLDRDWDELFNRENLTDHLKKTVKNLSPRTKPIQSQDLLPPIGTQEVWAAGVTYYRSRDARMEEAETAGGGDFYDRVYLASRPELFFKGTASRVVGHGQEVRIRSDSKWNVPEPELTLAINSRGRIIGYTIGNDMSSRDIEGENPLYLPQAKVYNKSCALGPGIVVSDEPLLEETEILLEIVRAGKTEFSGTTEISQIKRSFNSLVEYLFRDNVFPNGCFLLTGTGIVPPSTFTLQTGDEIRISIEPIGTLINRVG